MPSVRDRQRARKMFAASHDIAAQRRLPEPRLHGAGSPLHSFLLERWNKVSAALANQTFQRHRVEKLYRVTLY